MHSLYSGFWTVKTYRRRSANRFSVLTRPNLNVVLVHAVLERKVIRYKSALCETVLQPVDAVADVLLAYV